MQTLTTRLAPLAFVYCEGRRTEIPMVSRICVCGAVHDLADQSLWYATRVGGNSENGYEPFCRAHDAEDVDDEPVVEVASVLVYSTSTPAAPTFPPVTFNGDTYGMCTGCGAVEVALTRATGTRDLSANGGHPAYPVGHGCELCD